MIEQRKVLIVDDDANIVDVVKSYLESYGYGTCSAYNGKEALRLFDKEKPPLLILDLMLPDIPGEEVCKAVRKKSGIPIIMLTAKVDEKDVLNGFAIGADNYVTKPFSPKQLVARVTALLRRASDEPSPLANFISYRNDDLIINGFKHEIKKKGQVVSLTPSEYRLLITMLEYPDRAFTREELITEVLGEKLCGNDRIIDAHIKNLRQIKYHKRDDNDTCTGVYRKRESRSITLS